MTESERYRQELSELGLQKGDAVMVHSSMKALGGTKRKPEEIIEDIRAVLGEEGTLLMPALNKMCAEPYAFVTDISAWI